MKWPISTQAAAPCGTARTPTGPALMFTAAVWVAFTAGVRAGEFD